MNYIEISSDDEWDHSDNEQKNEDDNEDDTLEKDLDKSIMLSEAPKIRLSQAKDKIKKINSDWSKANDYYLKKYQAKYRQDLISEKDENQIADYYNNKSEEVENQINDIIETIDRKPSENFYNWVDMLLARQEVKFNRILD
jgi:inactivated superfamily I helicase